MSGLLRAVSAIVFLLVFFVWILCAESAQAQTIGAPCTIDGRPGTFEQIGFPGNFRIICVSRPGGGGGGASSTFPGLNGRFTAPDPLYSGVPGSTMDMGGPWGKDGSTTNPNGSTGAFSRPDPQLGY